MIASELQAHGVDFTFAPVLDVDYGESSVIGDRALHRDPNVIAALAEALQAGLHAAGMTSVGKHFPGHGYVRADSHLEVPVDDRPMAEIAAHGPRALPAPGARRHGRRDARARDLPEGRREAGGLLARLAAEGAARQARLRRA